MKYKKVETFQKAVKKALNETASIFVEIKCSRFNQYTKTQEDFFVTSFTDMTSDKTLPPYHMVELESRFTYPYHYDQNFSTDYYSIGGITMNIDIYSLIKLFDITISRRDKYEA
jgi:hypothetical protein